MKLTPLGPTWGWRERAAEIVWQVGGLVIVAPTLAAYRALRRLLAKALP